jgi:hypothetical protein
VFLIPEPSSETTPVTTISPRIIVLREEGICFLNNPEFL